METFQDLGRGRQQAVSEEISDSEWAAKDFFFLKKEKYLFSLKKYFFIRTHFFNSLFCGGGGGLCYGAQTSLAVTGRVSCHLWG